MKFLLNMNLPRELGRKLAARGHEWRHVANLGMMRASDANILAEAAYGSKEDGTHVVAGDLGTA